MLPRHLLWEEWFLVERWRRNCGISTGSSHRTRGRQKGYHTPALGNPFVSLRHNISHRLAPSGSLGYPLTSLPAGPRVSSARHAAEAQREETLTFVNDEARLAIVHHAAL